MAKHHIRQALGRARAVRSRTVLFEDPAWEDRFEALIRLTQRTELIVELTGTDVRPARLKGAIDRKFAESGEKAARPRGLGRRPTSQNFLATKGERLDAAYLMDTHFGCQSPQASYEADSHLGRALDKLLEVWNGYRAVVLPSGRTPKIDFEGYCMLMAGLKSGAVEVHTCAECSTRYPWPAVRVGEHSCPACTVLDLKLSEGRRDIARRIRERCTMRGNSASIARSR